MKCHACNFIGVLSKWRVINLNQNETSTNQKEKVVKYYPQPGQNRFSNIYACPKCGTLRIQTPTDKS